MSFVCLISKVTTIQTKYLTLFDFLQQQPLLERTSMLCYAYIVYLVEPILHYQLLTLTADSIPSANCMFGRTGL